MTASLRASSFLVAVRFRDGRRQQFKVTNAPDDIDAVRNVVRQKLIGVRAVLVAIPGAR